MFKKYFNTFVLTLFLFATSVTGLSCSKQKKENRKFKLIEATISDVHKAMRSGNLTARQLVEAYIKRIKYYDQSTRLNSIVVINPDALKEADKLDKEFKRTGKLLPLQGIPIIVKDNYDTKGLQTSGGSLALKGADPSGDAYQVKKLKEAGCNCAGKIQYGGVGFQ
jgi:Asp-tRNA(Asn)/Glu-tRNA(Gln) amidotransferase A subunit family amidase